MLKHVRPTLSRTPPSGVARLATSSLSSPSSPYAATLPHLRIGRHTRVIFQGFTGRQATANARESLAWGTHIVGGVKPGTEGEHLGLPVLPSVRRAMETLRPDATGIYVPAALAPAAIEEAIAAEVPLVVAVAEHIPLHAMLRIHAVLQTQRRSRLVGANAPGIISAAGRCRIGFQPLPCFAPDAPPGRRVGIAARSGTLSYEAVASTSRAGLGQSLCIGVGGDLLPGTDLAEAFQLLAADPDTDAIALIGEIGGASELAAADCIRAYRAQPDTDPKPIVALVAGARAPPGRLMGHAGAFRLPGEPTVQEKMDVLAAAGATVIGHPEMFGAALRAHLDSQQRRHLHTASRRTQWPQRLPPPLVASPPRRTLFLPPDAALDLLRAQGVSTGSLSGHGPPRYLAITVDRAARSPCVLAGPSAAAPRQRFPFDYRAGVDGLLASRVADCAQLPAPDALRRLLQALYAVFRDQQAFLVETAVVPQLAALQVVQARIGLDDAAHVQRGPARGDPDEAEAQASGIVYVKLAGDAPRNIGTVVNGAGLAMNTVDALAARGGWATNFLDTGGQATSETVRTCFALLLRDPRVQVIFVNVFGGLTLGDMIARGILLAFRETRVAVPVVVRIRGTNEAEGQAIIRDSGLPLFAYDSFDEAAAKVIALAREAQAGVS